MQHEHNLIDRSRARIDGSSGARKRPPPDRGKLGSKQHIVVDARGIPLVILVSEANRHDSTMFEKCVNAIAGLLGCPRKRPAKLHAYKGYDLQTLSPAPEAARHRQLNGQTGD